MRVGLRYRTWEEVESCKELILRYMTSCLESGRKCKIEINGEILSLDVAIREVSKESDLGKSVAPIWANLFDAECAQLAKRN